MISSHKWGKGKGKGRKRELSEQLEIINNKTAYFDKININKDIEL